MSKTALLLAKRCLGSAVVHIARLEHAFKDTPVATASVEAREAVAVLISALAAQAERKQ